MHNQLAATKQLHATSSVGIFKRGRDDIIIKIATSAPTGKFIINSLFVFNIKRKYYLHKNATLLYIYEYTL